MRLPYQPLLCALASVFLLLQERPGFAQADFALHATPVTPAPPDPVIARALRTIQPTRIEQTINALIRFGTRSTLSSMEADLPQGQGINAAADWIAGQFDEISKQCGGCLEVHRDEFVADPASGATWARRIPKPTRLTNIYAILRGTDPVQSRRMYLVSGHYDSRNTNVLDARGPAPGANDDASGVAVSLECARALSRMRFPATLVFVAVAGEEQGLVGSQHLAKLAHEQGWQLKAVLNNDIVGGNTTPDDTLQLKDRVRVFSEGIPSSATQADTRHIRAAGEENDSASRQLARTVADVGRSYFPAAPARFAAFLVFRPDRYMRGGDHSSFNAEGFAAVRFTEWREDYDHQHKNVVLPAAGLDAHVQGDLPQFVDFNYVSKVARLNAATLATLASSPGEPSKVTIVIKNMVLDNNTILSWEPPAGAAARTHYEVLWRETTAADWQFVKRVVPQSPETTITPTMPISGDNVVFGVRAVDATGHRSLVVVP